MSERRRTVGDRLRTLLRRLRRLPHRVEVLDRRLGAVDGEVHAIRHSVAELGSRLDQVAADVAESRPRFAELRDSIHLVARRSSLHRRPTRVLFLVHVLGAWDSYHALVEAMARSDDFEPIVASIPRRFRGSNGLYGEEEVHRGLSDRGVTTCASRRTTSTASCR